MRLTERQKKHVAKLIRKHTGWTIGWYLEEDRRDTLYQETAAAIAKYLQRRKRGHK